MSLNVEQAKANEKSAGLSNRLAIGENCLRVKPELKEKLRARRAQGYIGDLSEYGKGMHPTTKSLYEEITAGSKAKFARAIGKLNQLDDEELLELHVANIGTAEATNENGTSAALKFYKKSAAQRARGGNNGQTTRVHPLLAAGLLSGHNLGKKSKVELPVMTPEELNIRKRAEFYNKFRQVSKANKVQGLENLTSEWSDESDEEEDMPSPRQKFMQSCIGSDLPPEATVLRTNTKLSNLKLSHFGLGNVRTNALAESLPVLKDISEFDISNNRLTDVTIAKALKALRGRSELKSLNISQNLVGGGRKGQNVAIPELCALIKEGNLQELTCVHAKINDHNIEILAPLLRSPARLSRLTLSNNNIGKAGCDAISEVLERGDCCVSYLDLSWNAISGPSAEKLALALELNSSLITLNLSYNKFAAEAQVLARGLLPNKTLENLDISYNNLPGQVAFVFGYLMEVNKHLKDLQINGNPLAEGGGRALLRAISSGRSTCSLGIACCTHQPDNIDGAVLFDPNIPESFNPYSLDLKVPYEWVVARDILELITGRPGCAMQSLIHTTGKTRNAISLSQGSEADWTPPEEGILTFQLRIQRKLPNAKDCISEQGLGDIIDLINAQPTALERREVLRMICCDVVLAPRQTQRLVDSLDLSTVEIVTNILPRASRCCCEQTKDNNLFQFVHRNLRSERAVQQMIAMVGAVSYKFNVFNPTGHWHLDMSVKGQREVAISLASINIMEMLEGKRSSGRHDTSQHQNWTNFRNETFDHQVKPFEHRRSTSVCLPLTAQCQQPIVLDDLFFDTLPRRGHLDFDYVSTTRPPVDAEAIENSQIPELLKSIGIDSHFGHRSNNKGTNRISDV
jgi:Ran GTPase-activating protein (RanGAP) involved in mRNA processing and transport